MSQRGEVTCPGLWGNLDRTGIRISSRDFLLKLSGALKGVVYLRALALSLLGSVFGGIFPPRHSWVLALVLSSVLDLFIPSFMWLLLIFCGLRHQITELLHL